MSYPGEYVQPLPRKTNVQVPVISGYVAARLRGTDPVRPITSGEDTTMALTFENMGNTAVSVLLRQTTDRSVSGTRINVVSGIVLVAGGRRTVSTQNCYQEFLEVYCYAGGPSNLRLQIDSLRRWEQMGFDKTADLSFYPTSLWQAKPTPVATAFS